MSIQFQSLRPSIQWRANGDELRGKAFGGTEALTTDAADTTRRFDHRTGKFIRNSMDANGAISQNTSAIAEAGNFIYNLFHGYNPSEGVPEDASSAVAVPATASTTSTIAPPVQPEALAPVPASVILPGGTIR
jgi:hypothetical protein